MRKEQRMRIVIVERTIRDFFATRKEVVEIRQLDGTALLWELDGRGRYDVYLFDVEMPGMNGLELAAKVRFMDANARIIFLTSYERYALQGIRAGAYYYILKDSYQEELCLMLERVCREEEERREDYYVFEFPHFSKANKNAKTLAFCYN